MKVSLNNHYSDIYDFSNSNLRKVLDSLYHLASEEPDFFIKEPPYIFYPVTDEDHKTIAQMLKKTEATECSTTKEFSNYYIGGFGNVKILNSNKNE